MKIVSSKKNIIVISLLFLNISTVEAQSPWKENSLSKDKKDCTTCYVDLNFSKKTPKIVKDKNKKIETKSFHNNGYSYSLKESDIVVKSIDRIYVEKKNRYDSKIVSIQLGAFRHYAGAKEYVKKYAILSSKYKVTIKAGAKAQKPLYRVRIEGFSSQTQAEEFKSKYGLVGAFLVMN